MTFSLPLGNNSLPMRLVTALLLIIWMGPSALAAQHDNALSEKAFASPHGLMAIFGEDDRTPMVFKDGFWKKIGKLVLRDHFFETKSCTATLVGERLILTAAHCLIDPSTGLAYSGGIDFLANERNGKNLGSSGVDGYVFGNLESERGDWAIAILKEPLGQTLGYFDLANSLPGATLISVGYSADYQKGKYATIHAHCNIREKQNELIKHDCDTKVGNSGGPLLVIRTQISKQEPAGVYLTGVHSQGSEETYKNFDLEKANIAVSVEKIIPELIRLRNLTQ